MTIWSRTRASWLLGAVFGLSLLHHVTPDSWTGTHEVLKRAFYVPVVIAALRDGPASAFGLAAVSTVAYLPHLAWTTHAWAVPRAAHFADLALLPVVGLAAGVFNRRINVLNSRHEQARTALAHREAQLSRLVGEELKVDRFVTLGRVTGALLPDLTWSCKAACGSLLAARAPGTSSEQRGYELAVALRELGTMANALDACNTLVAPQAPGFPTDTADTIRLAAQLVRGVLAQRDSTILPNEPLRPMRVAMPRDHLLRVLIGVTLDGAGPGALVHVHTRRSARAAVLELRITGNHVPACVFRDALAASETPAVPRVRLLVEQTGGVLEAREDKDALVCEIRIPLADTAS